MTIRPDRTAARVLLVPGGGSHALGYFPDLAQSLGPDVRVLEIDPPQLDLTTGHRWLTLPDHARWLTQAVRRDGAGPVVVVGHSLGALVALRLALDEPELVAGLLLLDPSPPLLAALLPRPLLGLIAGARKAAATLRRIATTASTSAEARAVPLRVRLRWFFVLGGPALAADVAAGGVSTTPTILVSASGNAPGSAIRRAHERLVAWIPDGSFEVWPETTHPLHLERPDRVAGATRSLLRRAAVPTVT